MAGGLLDNGSFSITGSAAEGDLAGSIQTETVDGGVFTPGGTSVSSYSVDRGWRRVTFRLFTESGDLDLHLFDDGNRHVGWDTQTTTDVLEIPDATYSGSDSSPEEIRVRKDRDVTYRVEIRDHVTGKQRAMTVWSTARKEKSETGSAFTLQAVLNPASDALVSATPGTLEFGIDSLSGGSARAALSERSGIARATGLRVSVVDPRDATDRPVPAAAFQPTLQATTIEPGATKGLDIGVVASRLTGAVFPVRATVRIQHDDGFCDLTVRVLKFTPCPAEELTLLDSTHVTIVPASAHAPGVGETRWFSDLAIHNPVPEPMSASVYYLPSSSDNTRSRGTGIKVESGHSVLLTDVVEDLFGFSSSSGALLIAHDRPLVVTSRTFNDATSGTFGQFVPGIPTDSALTTGDSARLIQLTRNSDFRTNIGFVNTTREELTVEVDIHGANGGRIGQHTYSVQPYGYFQKNDILATNVDDAYAIVTSSTVGARYFTYASIVDNHSGDPILSLPQGNAVHAGTDVFIPAAAHVQGAGGTSWRTDLEVHNPGSGRAQFTIALLKRDLANTSPTTRSFSLDAGKSVRYEDVLQGVFGFDGAGALRVTPTTGSIMVTSRTFNDASSGTFGQFIAGVTTEAAIAHGQEGRLIQLSRSSSTSNGFRTNIGFVNATGSSIEVKVEMYTGQGTRLGEKTYTLKPFEYDQVSDIFGQVTNGEVENGFAVVSTLTSGGRLFAYASVVDNRSGDPVYMPALVLGDANTPPESPPTTSPTVTASATSSTEISVSWTAVDGATGYKLYRSGTLIHSGSGRTFNHTGLDANTQYCYRVRAYNDAGDGPLSAQACATTSEGAPTSAPTLTATVISADNIRLSWTPVAGAAGYKLYRGNTLIYSGSGLNRNDTGLEHGTRYCYRVKAFNSAGDGPLSAQQCATTSGGAPSDAPTLSVSASGSDTIELSWSAVAEATRYDLYQGQNRIYTGPNRSYEHTGLDANTSYCYRVRGVNGSGEGPLSPRVCATIEGGSGTCGEWQSVDSGSSTDLYGVARGLGAFAWGSPSGVVSGFVAVGKGGAILTSPDGRSWTEQDSGTTRDIYRVAYGPEIWVPSGPRERS